MKFKIVAVGKIKENYFKDAIAEYVKRIGRFATVEIVEIAECLFNGEPNAKQIDKIVNTEGTAILQKCEGYVVAMDIEGKQLGSVELSNLIVANKQTNSTFTFVIGGSYGLSQEVKERANMRCSFGKITLPHQLFRVILCEQLYRACCIENNVSYHK
ncbi:MAG: 23S rRNA (pseudouridine(1915)-N(3))-methyltransferase RlmH [Clostridia bacterium]|nr:23S rRNA (pseudouridine(1915)-N(3))-methyltransferase RlmH [Clostridia bacterium]